MNMLSDAAKAGSTVIIATHNMALVDSNPARTIRCAEKTLTEL